MFSNILYSFSKNCIIHQLKKMFFKISFCFFFKSMFIWIYGFRRAFWINSIILWTSFKTNLWFNACFKFLMCITYSVLWCKSATSFSTISIFILSVKMVNHYEVYVIFQDINHQLLENILHHFFRQIFYEIFIKLSSIFYPLKIIYWKLLWHCPPI